MINFIDEKSNFIKIIIDGNKNKKYEHELKSILRGFGIKTKILKISDDRKYPLIRLADFMAGLIRSYVNNRNKDNLYMFDSVKQKIIIIYR